MKIAFILPGKGSSGGVRCVSLIGQRMRSRGHEVRLLFRKPKNDLRDWVRSIQTRVLYRTAPDWIRQFEGPVEHFENLETVEFDPAEILVGVGMQECAQLDRVDSLPNPKVQYLHGSTPFAPKQVEKALDLRYPKIVVASYLKELVARKGHEEDVIAVIHNGIDLADYFPSVPESQRDGIGTIYGSHPVKDPETVISVLNRLAASRQDMPIRVFSTDRRPKQIPPNNYLRHPGLAHAREIYSRSLVWIMASRSEGFSMPALEAMACGCVVVATDCGGPGDIIQNEVNGFLVPVGDADAIVNRARLLVDNPDLRNRMQKQALETVRRFPWEKCVNEIERALGGIVHQRAATQKRAENLALL